MYYTHKSLFSFKWTFVSLRQTSKSVQEKTSLNCHIWWMENNRRDQSWFTMREEVTRRAFRANLWTEKTWKAACFPTENIWWKKCTAFRHSENSDIFYWLRKLAGSSIATEILHWFLYQFHQTIYRPSLSNSLSVYQYNSKLWGKSWRIQVSSVEPKLWIESSKERHICFNHCHY